MMNKITEDDIIPDGHPDKKVIQEGLSKQSKDHDSRRKMAGDEEAGYI